MAQSIVDAATRWSVDIPLGVFSGSIERLVRRQRKNSLGALGLAASMRIGRNRRWAFWGSASCVFPVAMAIKFSVD
jgi:hypothetical protein